MDDDGEGEGGTELFEEQLFGFSVEQTSEEEGVTEEEGFIVSRDKVVIMTPTHLRTDSTCLHNPNHSASC
jgi:hypothetical protein